MSKDVEKFFFGPADVVLYDATNGYLFCGYLEMVVVSGKTLAHTILDGNIRQYAGSYKFKSLLQQSDQALMDSLVTRRATRQTIYITGLNNQVVLSNVFISAIGSMSFDIDAIHGIVLTAATNIESDVNKKQNLLGADGKFEVDTNSDGLADGWTASVVSKSIGTSHLSGGGNQQNIEFGSSGHYFYHDIIAPFESPRRITASAYIEENSYTEPAHFSFGFKLLNSAGSIIQTESTAVTLSVNESQRITITAIVAPSDQIVTIRPILTADAVDPATLGIDDYMIEFGGITAFSDN